MRRPAHLRTSRLCTTVTAQVQQSLSGRSCSLYNTRDTHTPPPLTAVFPTACPSLRPPRVPPASCPARRVHKHATSTRTSTRHGSHPHFRPLAMAGFCPTLSRGEPHLRTHTLADPQHTHTHTHTPAVPSGTRRPLSRGFCLTSPHAFHTARPSLYHTRVV